MKNYYYMVWSDAILSFKKHHPKKKEWKITLLIYITWIHAINWWIFFIWLKYFNIIRIPLLKLDLFPGDIFDGLISFAVEFVLPFGILNYLLIFRNDRYIKITQKYKNSRFRSAQIYSFTIAILAFLSAVLYDILN